MTDETILRSAPISASARASALAERLEAGARTLFTFANVLTDVQWRTPVPMDGRSVGVIVHHVASIYPLAVEFARSVIGGRPVTNPSMEDMRAMNAKHARENSAVTKEAALRLLAGNSGAAVAAIRMLSDVDLGQAAPVSLYGGAPLTCQFLLEDQAIRHSFSQMRLLAQAMNA